MMAFDPPRKRGRPKKTTSLWFRQRNGLQIRPARLAEDFGDIPEFAPDWGCEPDEDLSLSDTMTQRTKANGQRELLPWERKVAIFAAHRFECLYCGKRGELVIDHIVPVAAGGSSHDRNLAPACKPCNRSKRAEPLAIWVVKAAVDKEEVLRRWREAKREGEIAWLL